METHKVKIGNMKQGRSKIKSIKQIFYHICTFCVISLFLQGCGIFSGYSNQSIYHEDVKTVYVKMFDNQTFRRGVEYELTDALAKRIEAETPYKIVSSQDKADTVISGKIQSIFEFPLTIERQAGRLLEQEVGITAVVNWKNLKTGELLIDNKTLSASASYSEYQQQDFKYGSNLAANNLARNVVELMETKW